MLASWCVGTTYTCACSVCHVEITKRQYEVYNCGPELRDVPTLRSTAAPRVLTLRDPEIADFLLHRCLWTTWKPPTSWRMKVDQVYDLAVHVRSRRDGFLTGAVRVVRLRVGHKWVGPHHHNTSDAELSHATSTQWLHRVDYETTDASERAATSAFFQTIQLAWENYVLELAKLPVEDLGESDDGSGTHRFAYDKQDRLTHLRVKYLLETSLAQILRETGTFFRAPHAFELWRMAQEDTMEHRSSDSREDHFAGPLLDAPIAELMELYELEAMALEDVKIIELPRVSSTTEEEAEEEERNTDMSEHKRADSEDNRDGADAVNEVADQHA